MHKRDFQFSISTKNKDAQLSQIICFSQMCLTSLAKYEKKSFVKIKQLCVRLHK